jgi:hypothetical protein
MTQNAGFEPGTWFREICVGGFWKLVRYAQARHFSPLHVILEDPCKRTIMVPTRDFGAKYSICDPPLMPKSRWDYLLSGDDF